MRYDTNILEKALVDIEAEAKRVKALARPGWEKEVTHLREHYARIKKIVKTLQEVKAAKYPNLTQSTPQPVESEPQELEDDDYKQALL